MIFFIFLRANVEFTAELQRVLVEGLEKFIFVYYTIPYLDRLKYVFCSSEC
jgi:hypothetical protein